MVAAATYASIWSDAREAAPFTSIRITPHYEHAHLRSKRRCLPPLFSAVCAGCRFREPGHTLNPLPRLAPGEWRPVGMGRMFPARRLLPRILHARMELRASFLPDLYPRLERTLRNSRNWCARWTMKGHVTFRSALPEGVQSDNDFHAASDGQLGGTAKVFRDWQISGDTEYGGRWYPLAKRSLNYRIRNRDPDEQGGLFEPQHNTYDIEFWGLDGNVHQHLPGRALRTPAEMARVLDQTQDAKFYMNWPTRCAHFMEEQLFWPAVLPTEGAWFILGLRNTSFERLRSRRSTNTVAKCEEASKA